MSQPFTFSQKILSCFILILVGLFVVAASTPQALIPVSRQLRYYSEAFNYAPLYPGGSLTASVQATITLTTCPLGLSPARGKQYAYISGGTGTSEAVLLSTSSTCADGASGTLVFTPANSHSGSWTITSANGGITEAEYAAYDAGYSGVSVYIPQENITINAPVPYLAGAGFIGTGVGTVLTPATCSTVIFDANVPANHPYGLGDFDDNVEFSNMMFDGHSCTGSNSIYGIRELLPGGLSDMQGTGLSGVKSSNLYCNNVSYCVYFQRSRNVYLSETILYANSKLYFTDNAFGLNAQNGRDSTNINLDRTQGYYYCESNNCPNTFPTFSGAQIVCQSCELFTVTNAWLTGLYSTSGDGSGYIEVDGGEGAGIFNSSFELCDVCVSFKPLTSQGYTFYPDSIQVVNSSITQPYSYGIYVADGTGYSNTQASSLVSIIGGQYTETRGPANTAFVYIGQYVTDVVVDGSAFSSGYNFGSTTPVNFTGVYIAANAGNVTVSDSTFQNISTVANTAYGIDINGTNNNYISYSRENQYVNMTYPVFDPSANFTVASTVTLSPGRYLYKATGGTGTIATINTCSSTVNSGTSIQIVLPANVGVTNTGNISVTPFSTSIGGGINLYCNGTRWQSLSHDSY